MISQIFIYLVVHWPFRVVFDFKMNGVGLEKVMRGRRYLIAANHRMWMDVFLILSSLPLSVFWKLLPIKIFTANVYLKTWWQKLILYAIGGFPAYFSPTEISGVEGGLTFSDKGCALFIFPEGKRRQVGQVPELKPGLGRLIKSRDFVVLPVHISYGTNRRMEINWRRVIYPDKNLRNRSEKVITLRMFEKILYG